MSRRAPTRTGPNSTRPTRRPNSRTGNDETDAPLVPDVRPLTARSDRTDTPTDTTRDCAERRRRDPFELALMEDSD